MKEDSCSGCNFRLLGFKVKGGGRSVEEMLNMIKNNKMKNEIQMLCKRLQPFNNEEFEKSLYKY